MTNFASIRWEIAWATSHHHWLKTEKHKPLVAITRISFRYQVQENLSSSKTRCNIQGIELRRVIVLSWKRFHATGNILLCRVGTIGFLAKIAPRHFQRLEFKRYQSALLRIWTFHASKISIHLPCSTSLPSTLRRRKGTKSLTQLFVDPPP